MWYMYSYHQGVLIEWSRVMIPDTTPLDCYICSKLLYRSEGFTSVYLLMGWNKVVIPDTNPIGFQGCTKLLYVSEGFTSAYLFILFLRMG